MGWRKLFNIKFYHVNIRVSNLVLIEFDPEYMGRTQPHQVAKKKNVAARYEGLKQADRLTPQTNDLRLKQLSQTLSKDEYKNQKQGAYNRTTRSI